MAESDDLGLPVALGGDATVKGTSNNILVRVKALLPHHWWSYTAPFRDMLIGGVSDSAAFCYNLLTWARLQTRLATATDMWLDVYSFDFLGRYLYRNGLPDNQFRALIDATILQERVTRKGMVSAITTLVNIAPRVIEPWSPQDCGGYGTQNVGYGRSGAWGSIALQNQVFMQISRASLAASGVPSVNGYGNWNSGYASPSTATTAPENSTVAGVSQYVGSAVSQIGVTDNIIEQVIGATRPTATPAWIRFADGQPQSGQQALNLGTGGPDPT